jgi:hypothetical protein
MSIPTPQDTYNHAEELIHDEINLVLAGAHLSSYGEALTVLKEDLRVLYKHLENIQAMRTSYTMSSR